MAAAELPEMPTGPIMELYGQRKRFHVPHGLKPLLEELTREILRYQPEDIYSFLSQLMSTKLDKRDNGDKTTRKSWNATAVLGQVGLDELLDTLEITKDQADQYATKIQAVFRGHKARKSLTEHGKVLHKDHKKSWEWKKWSWEGPSALTNEQLEELLDEHQVTLTEANKYATKIQAVFRGHKVRRSLGSNESGKGKKSDDVKKSPGAEIPQPPPPPPVPEIPDLETLKEPKNEASKQSVIAEDSKQSISAKEKEASKLQVSDSKPKTAGGGETATDEEEMPTDYPETDNEEAFFGDDEEQEAL